MEKQRLPIFAKRFNELRRDMSQDEFSKHLGISRPTVGFYENGARIPDALVLRQIAERCNVSTDWLLGLSNSPKRIEPLSQFSKISQMIVQYSEALNVLAQGAAQKELFDTLFNNPVCEIFDEYISSAWQTAAERCQWILDHSETFETESGDIDGSEILRILNGKIENRPRC